MRQSEYTRGVGALESSNRRSGAHPGTGRIWVVSVFISVLSPYTVADSDEGG